MNSLKKTLYEGYKAAAEKVLPDLKNSNFLETGMLTKEEFKVSGDKLISNDPSWRWNKDGICLEKHHILCNKILLEEEHQSDSDINIYNFKDEKSSNTIQKSENTENTCDTDSDDDMLAEFEEKDLIEDTLGMVQKVHSLNHHYYNVSITYDDYYRTPRIWFEGIDSYGNPLKQKEIYSDFMVEYIKVSLTLEVHPLLEMNCISVHPCKHAYAMQKMFAFELEKKNTTEVKIEDYLVHFLKFASCVIPQLEFDKSHV